MKVKVAELDFEENGTVTGLKAPTAASDAATKIYVDDKVKTDVPANAKFTDTTYTEITTAEIDAGTASTLRTITGRRIKYIIDKIISLFPTKISELTNDSGFLTSITKSDVGLGNVDNTSDIDKPISIATQSALNLKADKTQILTNVPANAKFTDTVYTHPTTHPASMITESTTRRFVSDTEKSAWNAKWDYDASTIQGVKVNNAGNADTVNGKTVAVNVPSGAKFTDTITTVVDNLTSTSATSALSAKQGKALNDLIGDIGTALDLINGEVV